MSKNRVMCFYTIVLMSFEASKDQRALLFLSWFFINKKISIILQKMQAFCILSWRITIGLATSRLSPFQNTSPSSQPTYYRWLIVEMKRFWHIVCPNLTTFKFSLFYDTFVHFLNRYDDAFINKVLQGFDEVILLNTWIHVIFFAVGCILNE
jgi:hypothetical protein